ncbi:MAG: Pyruvate formate-lyase activating enzyme family protein [Candidatus Methanohalarchaeum thermophilum]|uniref:Pyruvate formate-lyase activating enzyme family protein n=1 Tax=Methanohalarchaeum thermophilum TaxID=1903181 RepID=A0A1Q6DV98_METT1|nr:MAG: Pyruvate formate-lyase activating enzyme family protein [Candidatus Methanohalarchaeum thermophilum]
MSENKILIGELPTGCRLCEKGAKAVLFLTGQCDNQCSYCPVSVERKNKDITYINEKEVSSREDLLHELKSMNALGTGITGGEPLLCYERLIRYLKIIKEELGGDHHVHLYTTKPIDVEKQNRLKMYGLDEIRYHFPGLNYSSKLHKSLELSSRKFDTGIELPSIPNYEEEIIDLIEKINEPIDFLNLDELEFSESNFEKLKERGFRGESRLNNSIKGSKRTAKKVFKELKPEFEFTLHFCSSSFKDSVQLKNRYRRKSKNIKNEYEEITEDGTLLKAVLSGTSSKEIYNKLKKNFGVPEKLIEINKETNNVETAWYVAEELSEELNSLDIEANLIEFYPTEDRFVVQKIPLT